MARRKRIPPGTMRLRVRSLASFNGLRIWHCRELWCRSAAVALIRPPAAGAALKKSKKKKIKKKVAVPVSQGSLSVTIKHGPKTPSQAVPICPQATDNPTASGLFAQRLKTLREKDGFGAVLFSSHVRKVSSTCRGAGRVAALAQLRASTAAPETLKTTNPVSGKVAPGRGGHQPHLLRSPRGPGKWS